MNPVHENIRGKYNVPRFHVPLKLIYLYQIIFHVTACTSIFEGLNSMVVQPLVCFLLVSQKVHGLP
jgi:hypothetical protein